MIVAEVFKINYHMQKIENEKKLELLLESTGFHHVKFSEEKGCLRVIASSEKQTLQGLLFTTKLL